MADFYIKYKIKGDISRINEVPELWREEVRKKLETNGQE